MVRPLLIPAPAAPLWREADPLAVFAACPLRPRILLQGFDLPGGFNALVGWGAVRRTPGAAPAADRANPLAQIRSLIVGPATEWRGAEPDAADLAAAAFGVIGYDAARQWTTTGTGPRGGPDPPPPPGGPEPDCAFFVPSRVLIWHEAGIAVLAASGTGAWAEQAVLAEAEALLRSAANLDDAGLRAGAGNQPQDLPAAARQPGPDSFIAKVAAVQEHIACGQIEKAVLSISATWPYAGSPTAVYRRLRQENPSPFGFIVDIDGHTLIGSSPELLVAVRSRQICLHPLAGTRLRRFDPAADARLAAELRSATKDAAEHGLAVRQAAADLQRVTISGTIRQHSPAIETHGRLLHVASHLEGRLLPDMDPLAAVQACFPPATVSGSPRPAAMALIDELEPHRRGWYAGGVGYITPGGDVNLALIIRSLLLKSGLARVQAGAGIVAASVPDLEYTECLNKLQAPLAALGIAL